MPKQSRSTRSYVAKTSNPNYTCSIITTPNHRPNQTQTNSRLTPTASGKRPARLQISGMPLACFQSRISRSASRSVGILASFASRGASSPATPPRSALWAPRGRSPGIVPGFLAPLVAGSLRRSFSSPVFKGLPINRRHPAVLFY